MTALSILHQSLLNLWRHPGAIIRIIALPTLLVQGIVGPVTRFSQWLVLSVVMNTITTTATLRLASLLPAIALDRPMAGYRRGRRYGVLPLLGVSVLMVLAGVAVSVLLSRILSDPAGITNLPRLVVAWILPLLWSVLVLIFNISLLSVLWGHFVDGRPLR